MESPLVLKRKRSTAVEDLREYYESISESADSELQAAGETSVAKNKTGDVIFKPYRAIGLVCDELGFVYHRNVQEKQLTASIGHAFLTYSGDKLRIIYASPHIDRKISSLAIYKDYVFTACGNDIHMWAKVHKKALLQRHTHPVVMLLVVGDTLLSLDSLGSLVVWRLPELEVEATWDVGEYKKLLMHPPTYLYKVLVAGRQELELLNTKTGQLVYAFPTIRKSLNSDIQALEEAGAVDIVGIGLESGRVIIANIRTDKVLYSYEAGSRITSLSFSSPDSTMEYSLLAASTFGGNIIMWDLNARRVHCELNGHDGKSVSKVSFVPSEPLLLSSSGEDNSLKMWLFERGQIRPRLLRSREGASAPATRLRFYGEEGRDLLAACGGRTVLQSVSLTSDHQSRAFSMQHRSKAKRPALGVTGLEAPTLSPATVFAFSHYREYDWANIVSCHAGQAECQLWSYERKAIQHEPKLEVHETVQEATTVQVTNCGNFALVGYANGLICKFNMQSGIHRGCFVGAHSKKVTGLGIDSANKYMTSAAADGYIAFWDFYARLLLATLNTNATIEHFVYRTHNALAAFANSKSELGVVDTKTRKVVREFGVAHNSRITDMCFSHDGKWLVSAAADRTLKVWDIMLGMLINWLLFPRAVVSLDFSPSGDCLATSLVDSKGIYLWINDSLYRRLTLNKSPEEPTAVTLPQFADTVKVKSRNAFYEPQKPEESKEPETSADDWQKKIKQFNPKENSTIEFSQEPFSKWQLICNIESIKEKNRPLAPPAELPAAPFFLFDLKGEADSQTPAIAPLLLDTKAQPLPREKHVLQGPLPEQNELVCLLQEASSKKQVPEEVAQVYKRIQKHLQSISGSRAELEFAELNSLTLQYKGEVLECLAYFVHVLTHKTDFELPHL